jgi:hypothetical protein
MSRGDVTSSHGGPPPQHYEIWVRGHLGETMCYAFPALQAQPRGEDTVLTGALPDQAALHGVLAEIEALGLELLEVRRADAMTILLGSIARTGVSHPHTIRTIQVVPGSAVFPASSEGNWAKDKPIGRVACGKSPESCEAGSSGRAGRLMSSATGTPVPASYWKATWMPPRAPSALPEGTLP